MSESVVGHNPTYQEWQSHIRVSRPKAFRFVSVSSYDLFTGDRREECVVGRMGGQVVRFAGGDLREREVVGHE